LTNAKDSEGAKIVKVKCPKERTAIQANEGEGGGSDVWKQTGKTFALAERNWVRERDAFRVWSLTGKEKFCNQKHRGLYCSGVLLLGYTAK